MTPSGLNLRENAGLKRDDSPAFTAAGIAGLAGLYGSPSSDSLASGDKGHERRIPARGLDVRPLWPHPPSLLYQA